MAKFSGRGREGEAQEYALFSEVHTSICTCNFLADKNHPRYVPRQMQNSKFSQTFQVLLLLMAVTCSWCTYDVIIFKF